MGNLGVLYQTRGDLEEAEELYRKSLALERELGRKQGMASDYGNLGNLHKTRANMDFVYENQIKAKNLFAEIGSAGTVEKIAGWMDEARYGGKVSAGD